VLALPVVERRGAPLVFRRWRPDMALKPGAYGIPAPPEDAPTLTPDIVLVPLVAFDRFGHRLGYGGGYYDRTLARLRAERPVQAIGCAHAAQEVARIPAMATDARLDWLLTERGARRPEEP
jgi:5-formyltetrahydrofolate cyclo-ligase